MKSIKPYLRDIALASLATVIFAGVVRAEDFAVIVNKDNPNPIDKALVVRIYSGEAKNWPAGGAIVAYDLPEDNAARAAFSADVLGKSIASMKSLAAQNVFSGKSVPPKSAASDDDVKKGVSGNKNAIGYIRASAADASVKVIPMK